MTTILWLKAFHVIFMVAWFAGIFYLPRLFVNHAGTNNAAISEQLKGMEKRLLYFVTPFAIFTLGLGIALVMQYGYGWFAAAKWLHIKLVLVIFLLCYHAYCFKLMKDFKEDNNKRTPRFYRIFNEIPVLVLFAIVILAYVKPF